MHFYRAEPTARTSWRLAILMGANSRTYKFALGSALLDFGREGRDSITLNELGQAYARHLLARDGGAAQAPTSSRMSDTDFLAVLEREREESVAIRQPTEKLVDAATRAIPLMVMQKFHNLRDIGQVAHTFYRLEGRGRDRHVRLTPALRDVAAESSGLTSELGARWSIVEASFDAEIGRRLLESGVELGADLTDVVVPIRRVPVTGLRSAIAGFQHGRCFYCRMPLAESAANGGDDPYAGRDVHVDHVVPYSWMKSGSWRGPNLNHLWNLVLACASCNLRKSARQPTASELETLLERNNAIANSPHPLRRTIDITMSASGPDAAVRRKQFMVAVQNTITDGRPTCSPV
ncbi:HNH endonuclease [Rhodococcoides kroppenstedtii]|uniref:HNH endonuclease n=1 Tax=Rhodococcoides kroppenstedtii TaxID=293050 RepID=UPI001BDEE336|nr:HNH endonuclease signature motif containing protein [Rhodococcus kroppenstedtii]MBT1192571.1 HNH endonuclease [Rhodococcus kroppenstedtii]